MAKFLSLLTKPRINLRKLKRKIRLLINRRIQQLAFAARLHRENLKKIQERSAHKPSKAKPGKSKKPGKNRVKPQRSRGNDRDLKKSAREEQLWKLRTDTMRERTRDRKQHAMDRWKIAVAQAGAYQGR